MAGKKLSQPERKGEIVSKDSLPTATKLAEKENTQVEEVRKYSNGAYGVFLANGKFRFVKGAEKEQLQKARASARYSKTISPRSAKIAFNKFYKNKSTKAKEWDLCNSKKTTNSSKFKRSPKKYDYPGLDDGSNCKTGKIKKTPKVSPSNIDKALAKLGRKRRNMTGGQRKQEVSLKTAVSMLRHYYAQKYNDTDIV